MDRELAMRIQRLIGMGMILTGFLMLSIGILSMLDPLGAKLADDSDPFGKPSGLKEITIYFTIVVGLLFVGLKLFRVKP